MADGIRVEDVHLFGHFPDDPIVRSDVADYYFEVQRFDRDVGRPERLEAIGELDNTLRWSPATTACRSPAARGM